MVREICLFPSYSKLLYLCWLAQGTILRSQAYMIICYKKRREKNLQIVIRSSDYMWNSCAISYSHMPHILSQILIKEYNRQTHISEWNVSSTLHCVLFKKSMVESKGSWHKLLIKKSCWYQHSVSCQCNQHLGIMHESEFFIKNGSTSCNW